MVARTGNRRLMREVNSKLLLGLIRRSDTISQVELLKKSRLSAGTVANIVKDLKTRGFVEEVGLGRSAAGRRPVLLRFNPRAQYVLGVELSAAETRVALVDLAGTIVRKTERMTDRDPQTALDGVCAEAVALVEELGIPRDKLLGVGIAVEGVIDPAQESIVLLANLGWRDVPVKKILETKLGIPAVVNNSGAGIGEYLCGVGRGCRSAVCLEVGSGIGTVTIVDGRVLRGAHGMAGEIGHSLAVPDGELCSCGKRGCLETVASARAIVAEAAKARRNAPDSSIPPNIDLHPLPEAIHLIREAAKKGDRPARQVIERAGRHLGVAVAATINFIDPELVLLTGMVANRCGGLLVDAIRATAAEHVLQNGHRRFRIELGVLGESAALVGAAASVFEQAFRVPVEPGA